MSIQNKNSLSVGDVMLTLDKFPVIAEKVIFKEALEEMGNSRLGIACIVNEKKELLGVLTDGDIRRKLLKVQKPFSAFFIDDALDHAINSPTIANRNDTLKYAVGIMEEKQIWDLPVLDDSGQLVGLLHLHKAIQALLEIKE